jgi:putative ATP-dependent endonuclease of OLD family
MNKVLGVEYKNEDDLHKYMHNNKTNCALKVFDTDEIITFPQYILDAIQ